VAVLSVAGVGVHTPAAGEVVERGFWEPGSSLIVSTSHPHMPSFYPVPTLNTPDLTHP
jgi:hypothetical protein